MLFINLIRVSTHLLFFFFQRYDVYQTLEKEAQAAKRGCFAPPNAIKIIRLVDLVGPANTQRAIAHLQQLQRHAQLDAIVENVFNAARFKLRIPSVRRSFCLCLSLSQYLFFSLSLSLFYLSLYVSPSLSPCASSSCFGCSSLCSVSFFFIPMCFICVVRPSLRSKISPSPSSSRGFVAPRRRGRRFLVARRSDRRSPLVLRLFNSRGSA